MVKRFPKARDDVLFCPQPRDIQFTDTEKKKLESIHTNQEAEIFLSQLWLFFP